MEEANDYRFGPVLAPELSEQDAVSTVIGDDPPVQEDIVSVAEAQSSIKPQLRMEFRARRDALSDKERSAGTRRVVERLLRHPDVHRAKTVLLYASYSTEVATDDLAKELLKRGKAVAYPKITSVAGLMTLWRVKNLDALTPHKHGIRAPDVTRTSPIEPIAVDCIIYPGIAFTRGLSRLGQGGGYYDRLSGKIADNCARIGVCFEAQMADTLPHEEHDARMHWVVTEATVYPFVPDPPVVALLVASVAVTAGSAADGYEVVQSATVDASVDTDATVLAATSTDGKQGSPPRAAGDGLE